MDWKKKLIDLADQRAQALAEAEKALNENDQAGYDGAMERVGNLNAEIQRVQNLLAEQQKRLDTQTPDLAEQKDLHHMDRALRHPVRAEADSVLGRLYGTDFHVNSTHHQAVRNLGEGLRPTAWSPEGLVEAYEHTSGLIWGTQFHPEKSGDAGLRLLRAFAEL